MSYIVKSTINIIIILFEAVGNHCDKITQNIFFIISQREYMLIFLVAKHRELPIYAHMMNKQILLKQQRVEYTMYSNKKTMSIEYIAWM